MITVTSSRGTEHNLAQDDDQHSDKVRRMPLIDGLFPESHLVKRPYELNRPVVFLTARVHAAETPSSVAIESILDFCIDSHKEVDGMGPSDKENQGRHDSATDR